MDFALKDVGAKLSKIRALINAYFLPLVVSIFEAISVNFSDGL
jgi:hypothetical protein